MKLLSGAEKAGVGAAAPEQLGLLKLLDDLKLLSLAENTLTNPATPALLAAAGAFLGGLVYLDVTAPDFGIAQWVVAGALGAPALVLEVAAVAIYNLFSGASRFKNLDRSETIIEYDGRDFVTRKVDDAATLIGTLEKRRVLSWVEDNRLLSLGSSLISKPLTLTESLGVLSTLEGSGILSSIESAAADKNGAAKVGLVGLAIVPVAIALAVLVPTYGLLLALPLVLIALAYIAVGVAISSISPPSQ